jgi:digeranylgeranylglycerophospholipid reductase
MKVSIIGAGPSGSHAGYLLAKQGHDVTIYEDHAVIGKPIACTGIVTKALFDVIEKDAGYIVNELDGVDVVGPGGAKTHIPLKEYVICRHKFDNYVADKAQDAGAKIELNHRYIGREGNTIIFKVNEQEVRKETDILIGADGPMSKVAQSTGIGNKNPFWVGMQATVKAEFNPRVFTTWFGDLAPGFFAWSVPESATHSRVGVAVTKDKNCAQCFQGLMKMVGGEIVDRQGAPIPIYNPKSVIEKGNTFLVGDAAGLVKDTTGGGIITGMLSSKILAESIATGTSYSKNVKKLRKELWIHHKLRNMLNKFSDKDYQRLIKWMNNPKVQNILYSHPREYPSRFMAKLLFAEPRFAYFAKYALA